MTNVLPNPNLARPTYQDLCRNHIILTNLIDRAKDKGKPNCILCSNLKVKCHGWIVRCSVEPIRRKAIGDMDTDWLARAQKIAKACAAYDESVED